MKGNGWQSAQLFLNRVKHPSFPDSISGVIYQRHFPALIQTGTPPLPTPPKKYAIDALNGWDPSNLARSMFNASKTSDAFMHSRQVIKTIGNHKFCI